MKFLGFLLLIVLPSQLFSGTVMTVRGPIDSSELGRTLEHEHILVDFIGAEETGYHRWNRGEVSEKVLPYLQQAKDLGFQSMVECTPAFLGRDPRLLKSLSETTGLHLVTNTGYYGARENKYIPEDVQKLSADELAARWIQEFENGIEDTGIKPGFIKIGVDRGDTLSPMHEKLVRAACRTHLQTGLTIACHTGPTQAIFHMVEILEEEGVSPEALIWVHATQSDQETQLMAARLGVWLSLDNVTPLPNRIDFVSRGIVRLKNAGLTDRVLISHDAGWYRPGEENGGNFRDYTAISTYLAPQLMRRGFNTAAIDQLLVDNPRRAFELGVHRSSEHTSAFIGSGLLIKSVTSDSVAIRTRITKYPQDSKRKNIGVPGQVRVAYQSEIGHAGMTDWIAVSADKDFTHDFSINGLRKNTEYTLTAEARQRSYRTRHRHPISNRSNRTLSSYSSSSAIKTPGRIFTAQMIAAMIQITAA